MSTGWRSKRCRSSTSALPGSAVRARVRRPARQPLFRRRPSVATFYARGQTGQQLLIGAYQALERQIAGTVDMHTRHEMLELIVVDGRARGVVIRDMVTGRSILLCRRGGAGHRRLQQCVLPVHQRHGVQRHSHLAGLHRKGAYFANPCFTQIHPTCIPVSGDYQSKLTLMSESLRNDGRIWVPKSGEDKRDPRKSLRKIATITWSVSIRPSQSGAARYRLPRCQERLRRRSRGRAGRAGGLP